MNNFAKGTLTVGYFAALMIAVLLMAGSSWYLYSFMTDTTSAVEQLLPKLNEGGSETVVPYYFDQPVPEAVLVTRFAMAGLAFSSCGLFIGIALAFLGLALFLIGARGQMDASAETPNVSVTISRMSPGAVAFICSAAIIVTCLINRPQLEIENMNSGFRGGAVGEGPNGEAAEAVPSSDPEA